MLAWEAFKLLIARKDATLVLIIDIVVSSVIAHVPGSAAGKISLPVDRIRATETDRRPIRRPLRLRARA